MSETKTAAKSTEASKQEASVELSNFELLEQKYGNKAKGIVKIRAFPAKNRKGNLQFENTNTTCYILKDPQTKEYPFPFTPEEALVLFPNLGPKITEQVTHLISGSTRTVTRWNEKYLDTMALVLFSSGKNLNLANEIDRFFASILHTFPVITDKDVRSSAFHKFFYVNEEERAAQTSTKSQLIAKGINTLYNKMSPVQVIRTMAAYGFATRDVSLGVAQAQLTDQINKDPNKFLSIIDPDNDANVRVIINLAIEYQLITQKQFVLMYRDTQLGSTKEDAIDFLNDERNKTLKAAITSEVEKVSRLAD